MLEIPAAARVKAEMDEKLAAKEASGGSEGLESAA